MDHKLILSVDIFIACPPPSIMDNWDVPRSPVKQKFLGKRKNVLSSVGIMDPLINTIN
jgi:hypothetical protein